MTSRQNLVIYQGETFEFSFDSLGIDLTNYTSKIYFRENVSAQADTILSDVTNITLDAAGVISIRIESAETYSFDWLDGVYDIWLVDDSNVTSRPYWGSVTIVETVTRG